MVLLSGGVESATLLFMLASRAPCPPVHPLFFDYGQKGARCELSAARACLRSPCVADVAGDAVRPLEVMDLSSVGAAFRKRNRRHVPLPHRNLPLLSLALSWATLHAARELALGVTADDAAKAATGAENLGTFSPGFIARFGELASSLDSDVALTTPLAELDKAAVVARGRALGVDFATTYSCMRGGDLHCGSCEQCNARRRAFVDAGLPEPAHFYSSPPRS